MNRRNNDRSIICILISSVCIALLATVNSFAEQPRQTLTPQQQQGSASSTLQAMIQTTLESNLKNRSLDKDRNGAWQVIHGAVAYGPSLPLTVDGKELLAIDYLLDGGEIQGWELSIGPALPATKKPGIIARVDAGSFIGQGHTDQWLGYFSQIPLSLDRKVVVSDQSMQLMDWARQAQWDVPNNTFREYSWTLIALTNFFPQDQNWQASDGNTWTLEPLVRFEAQQDLSNSPCGGMHRLMGLAHAVRYRQRLKGSMDQGWLMAKTAVDSAIFCAPSWSNLPSAGSTPSSARTP